MTTARALVTAGISSGSKTGAARSYSHVAAAEDSEDPEECLGSELAAALVAAERSSSDGEGDGCSSLGGEAIALSLVGEALTAVPSNLAAGFPALRRLCLHGNAIASVAGLSGLSALEDLNLSSNSVAEVPAGALVGLGQLTALNLASNCLAALSSGALQGLTHLRRLSLAHNSLTSLAGLAALHGGSLERLDVRDNALASLAEFSVLAGLPWLAELQVAGGVPGNPVCRQPQYRLAVVAALPRLKRLDGQAVSSGEAVQYLAALQLQVFQPALAPPPPATVQQRQQQVQAQRPAEAAVGRQGDSQQVRDQQTEHPPAEQLPACGNSAPLLLQRIQRVLASFAGMPAPLNQVQPQEEQQGPRSSDKSSEEELLKLLQSYPQLAEAISGALQQVQQPARLTTMQQQRQGSHAWSQPDKAPAVQQTSCGAQTEPESAVSAAEQAAAEKQDELQQQVRALQDEVQTLQAEMDTQAAAAQHAQQGAVAAARQAQQQVAEAARLADVQVAEARQKVATALEQARGELVSLQTRCEELEGQLVESRSGAAAGQRRQQELEYELARAWQELDGSEASHQADQQRAAADAERQAAELEHGRAELAAVRSEVGAARQEVVQQRQLAERLQAEGTAARVMSSKRQEQLQEELVAARGQLAEHQQQAQEAAGREREAAQQLRQLSTTLAAVHEEHDAALGMLRQQQQRELQAVAADAQATVAAAQAERDDLQRQLAATEAEFRYALQEAARESQVTRQDLEALAAECVELRRALQDSQARRQEAEGLAGELSDVVQQQKLRMRGLAQEKTEACARLQAMNPQELERLRGEILALRERAGELAAIRDQLGQERRLSESLQQRLAGTQQQLLEARQEAATRLAEAEVECNASHNEAVKRTAAAESASAEARGRVEQLAEEAQNLRDAVKVKEAMVDSANERIADLKRAVAEAQAAADEARVVAEDAEEELRVLQAGDVDKQESLRAEVEAQEGLIDQLERRLAEAERRAGEAGKRAAAAEAAAAEKESMIAYVGEEVERVKALFEQKEARLTADRSGAQQAAAQLRAERDRLAASVQQLEVEVHRLGQQLREEQVRARAASEVAAQHQGQAGRAAARVLEVEEELREVLAALEQHKAASAAKFAQLQSVLHDELAPFLH